MRISSRLVILFLVIAIVFGAFFFMFYYIKQEEMRLYKESDRIQRKETIEAVLRANESMQKSFTKDNAGRHAIRDYALSAAYDSSKTPFQDLGSRFSYSLLQIYDSGRRKLYSHTEESVPGLAEYHISTAVFDTLKVGEIYGYYSIFNHDILYCTAGVIPTESGKAAGYLMTAKKLDNIYTKQLSEDLRQQVKLSLDYMDCESMQDRYDSCTIIPLKDYDGKTLAWMSFSSTNPFLRQLQNLAILIIFGTMGFVFIFLLMQYFLIQQWISTPLAHISQSLRQSNSQAISKLSSYKNEFGDIARLVESFFIQKEELLLEIEERSRASARLLEMEEQTRKILATSPESIIVTDIHGNIQSVNEESLRLLLWESEEEIVHHNLCYRHIVYQPDIRIFEKLLELLNLRNFARNIEMRIQRKDGTHFPALISGSVVTDSPGTPSKLIFITRDLSERKELEAQLRQSQKMESIGTLAGGIAHDFNNIITIIAGYISLSLGKIEQSPHAQDDLNEALKSCLRAKDIIGKILTFSHQSEPNISPIEIAEVVRESLPMIRTLLPSKIDIKSAINSSRYVLADSTQLQQILINLATNAFHAMSSDGGTLTITLQDVQGFEIIGINQEADHDSIYVHIRVSDTGSGISADNLSRIFDPYFSTKDAGEGTGLGLSIVHGIITGYKGIISVQSQPGKGTDFDIYLPILQGFQLADISSEERVIPFTFARIMIVDDEPALTEIFSEALESEGYEVQSFTDAIAALEYFAANYAEYDLIIADINMPELDGIRLTTSIKAIKNIPVILYTGFLDKTMKERIRSANIAYTLSKPVMPDEMVEKVKKVLFEYR